MPTSNLKIPKAADQEIFYDAHRLKVAFRPRTKAPATDLRTTSLRVVVQAFGNVIEDRFFARGTDITFGSHRKNSVHVSIKGFADPVTLIRYEDTGHVKISVSPLMTGAIQNKDKIERLEDVAASDSGEGKLIYLSPGSKGVLQTEHILVYFEEILDPEKLLPIPFLKNISDPYLVRWVAISVALHLFLLLLLKFLPPGFFSFGKPPVVDKMEQGIEVKIDQQKFPPFTPKSKIGQMISRGPQGKEGEGARAGGAEGARGAGKPGRTGGGRKLTTRDVGRAGVLDFFNKGGSKNVFDSLLSEGSGISGAAQNLGMAPAEPGMQGGGQRYGKGLQGTGSGGGNKTAGIGEGLGTKNRGGLGAQGTGIADFGGGRDGVRVSAQIPDDEVVIAGTLSKEEVERVINNKMGQIKYCYEKELVKKPSLKGKIVTNFIIGLEGSVTRSVIKQSSMGDAAVESCINSVMRSLKFPRPGGGTVEVFFPFLFRVAG